MNSTLNDKKGPFLTEEASTAIMHLFANELSPAKKEIYDVALDLTNYTQNFLNSFFRLKLSSLTRRFNEAHRNFLKIYHVYETPDELFKDYEEKTKQDQKLMALMMADYMNSSRMVRAHFDEGFRMLEVLDRTLLRYSQSADQRVTFTLSIVALIVALIGILNN